MAVKYTDSGIVHQGTEGGKTGCGFDTNLESKLWKSSSSRITCDKDGCKN